MKYYPDLEEFKRKSEKGNLIPVYREILADMETPVSAFSKIASDAEYAYLLESVEGGEKLGRYSFLGSNPHLIFKSGRGRVEIIKDGEVESFETDKEPLYHLERLVKTYKAVELHGLPRFYGGAVGYLSYDYVRYLEQIPDENPDDLNLPLAFFVFTDTILIFDHLKHIIKVVSNAFIQGSAEEAYREATSKIEFLISKLREPVKLKESEGEGISIKIQSNLSKESYEACVEKAKDYIRAGEIIQAVLSQRLSVQTTSPPFFIYRALRRINPSPYMYYLKYGSLHILGSSPEILVRCVGGEVEVRPIAGTRRRGGTEAEDAKLEKELLQDSKELAEHLMLVDLGRNDIGRVCEYGSVSVPELMIIEKYSHVMHIVSSVKGRLKPGVNQFEVLRACFPAGTVTGAPKIRAMQVIEELEPVRRGIYAGCIGYFGFSGALDTCIAIRTIIFLNGVAYIQAGAGVVADSIPEREYYETMSKAETLIKAIEMAERGLE
jgi:anthranilate synthase component 1